RAIGGPPSLAGVGTLGRRRAAPQGSIRANLGPQEFGPGIRIATASRDAHLRTSGAGHPAMSAIKPDELKEPRQRLWEMRRRLLGTIDGLGDEALSPSARLGGGQTAEAAGDTGDLSVQDDARDVAISLLETERQLLGQVTAALERLDRGEYG